MSPLTERELRSMLADHIWGTRRALRRQQAEIALRKENARGLMDGGQRWLEGYAFGLDTELRDLRTLADIVRGRA